MPVPTEEKLKQLESAHGRIAVLRQFAPQGSAPEWLVVLRSPTRQEWRMYKSMVRDERQKLDANENLFKGICIYPETGAEVELLLDRHWGIPDSEAFSRAVSEFGSAEADRGK